MSSKVFGFSKHEKLIEYHVHNRSTDQFKQVEKMTEMRSKFWNYIDTKFVVFKNKYEDKSKNL